MNKYRKVMKPHQEVVKEETEIRVTAAGSVAGYISRAAKLFMEMEKSFLTITATGNALTKAVTTAEVIKHRFKGLHQITKLMNQEIEDEFEPLEEGLEKVTETRNVACIEIKLSKEALDKSDKGYQEPIDESLVKEGDMEEMTKRHGTGEGKPKGKGKGKGKDKGKSKGKGKGKVSAGFMILRHRRHAAAAGASRGDLAGAAAPGDASGEDLAGAAAGDASRAVLSGAATAREVAAADGEGASARRAVPPQRAQFHFKRPEPHVVAQRALSEHLPESTTTVVLQFAFACRICHTRCETTASSPWCVQCEQAMMD